jgi:aldehyde dehydrogenase
MMYKPPGTQGSVVSVLDRYENFIGGKWLPPHDGRYATNLSPATAQPICEVPASSPADVEEALDAAHAAFETWSLTSDNRARAGAQRDRRCDR